MPLALTNKRKGGEKTLVFSPPHSFNSLLTTRYFVNYVFDHYKTFINKIIINK